MTQWQWGSRTYLMGIVNVTPDSFSGDGVMDTRRAVEHGARMETEGADILDVGGESTRPGSTPLSLEEELARVIPVVEALSKKVSVPISIDTYKAGVARRALDAGASIINDVWGGKMEPEILKVAAEKNALIILMHNRSTPKNAEQKEKLGGRYVEMQYDDLMEEIKHDLQISIDAAIAAGVKKEKIVVDPGIGFGKTTQQNLELLDKMREFKDLGYPILAGPSRKSFVGFTLDLPPSERLEGTAAAVALCIDRGADIVRVHDVEAMVRVAKFTDAVVRHKI